MQIEDKVKIIQSSSLFKNLSLDQIKVIAQTVYEQSLPANTIFIEQEDNSNAAYFIVEGGAKIYRITESGELVTFSVLGPNEVVGEMSLIDDEPRSACVETIKDTKVLILAKDDFRKILAKYPNVAIALLRILSKRVRETNRHIEDILSKNLNDRTWKILENLARYFPDKTISLSQEELAGIIGATRARVTEVLNNLQKKGKLILSHKQIHIK